MNSLKCIVHYEDQESYSQLKCLSEINICRIKEAKEKRLILGGIHNNEQVTRLPEQFETQVYGAHLEPCYKR